MSEKFLNTELGQKVFDAINKFSSNTMYIKSVDDEKQIVTINAHNYDVDTEDHNRLKLLQHVRLNKVHHYSIGHYEFNTAIPYLEQCEFVPKEKCDTFKLRIPSTHGVFKSLKLKEYLGSGQVASNKIRLLGVNDPDIVLNANSDSVIAAGNCVFKQIEINDNCKEFVLMKSKGELSFIKNELSRVTFEFVPIAFTHMNLTSVDELALNSCVIDDYRQFPKCHSLIVHNLNGKQLHILNFVEMLHHAKTVHLSCQDDKNPLYVLSKFKNIRNLTVYEVASALIENNFDEDVVSL